MKKLIQEWLMDQLGIVIDFNKVNFAKKVRDGYLISQVLCGFEVISKEELSFVKATEDKEEAFTNFVNYILIWLGRLNITIKDSELNDIINEKGNAGMNLFYELYLALQSKSKLHFITQRLILEKSRNSDGKFEVDKVKESLLQDMKFESGINCGLLVANADIIKWHKDRLIALNKHCEQARADYINYFKSKKGRKPKAVCTCKTYCPCQKQQEKVERLDFPDEASEDFTFQELMESYEQSKQIETVKPDYNEAKKVMRQLKSKRFEAKQRELQKTQLHTELCDEFWKDTIRKQENAIQELVDEKVLSQSFYERQMISKMLQVKHQQEVIKENRQFINDQIMKQKENDVINQLIMDQRLTDECACDFIYEKGRIQELHRRVYAEKLRLKKERIEKICRETAEDLVNFAIRLGEFEDEYHDKPSRRRYDDWVSLFVSCGSILPKVVPAEDILQDLTDLPEEEEELFIEEIERQEILDNKDFEKYLNNEWPWTLKDFSQFNIKFDLIDRGLNILGFIVHRLLLAKYPKTPLLPKPDFKFDYSVCINGVIEPAVVEKLQSLLSFKEIEVFEVLNAVDYCLGRYSAEQNLLEIDDIQSEDIREVKEMKKGKNRSKLQKGKKGKTVKDSATEPSFGSFSTSGKLHVEQHTKHNKKFQTPKIFPCEDFKISQAAHLGEIAQGILEQGEPLTDFLLAAMIVEYLYSITDKKGWVLINFPSNYNQAMTLEENLSSTPLCKDITAIKSIMDLAELEKKSAAEAIQKEKDMKRSSKIFPLPKKIKEADVYDTELTAYIKILKSHVSDVEQAESTLPPISRYLDDSADPLEKFYADQGCHYFFYYETFDYETLKYLARLIIGDFSLPRKPSIELFGRVVLLAEEEHPDRSTTTLAKVSKDVTSKEKTKKKLVIQKETTEEKSVAKTKSKKGKGKSKGKSKGKGKKKGGAKRRRKMSNVPKTFENKHVQAPPLEDIYEIVIEEDDPTIQPGEDKWKFIELPMSEDLMVILATLCENMENIYVEDFKQVLFMRRMDMNEVQPFISHTKSHLLEFIHRPDDRQQILHEFQMTFNSISECLRQDDEVKAELHCRADELRKALFTTSEANIKKSFSERDRIIEQHWLRRQLHDLTQIYICALQLELDRCIDTFNLITDYYVSGITNKPPEDSYFQKEIIKVPEEDSVFCFQQYTQWEDAFDIRYFKDELSNKVEQALYFAEKTKSNVLKVIMATQGKFALGKPKMDRRKGKKDNAVAPLPDIVKDNLDKIIEEWKTAIEAEFERLYLRLQLIKHDGDQRLKEMSNKVKEMMNEIYGMIRKRYNNEQSSIEQLCDVISNAIENETTIQQELLIDRDHFYAQPDVLLFPDDLPPPPQPVKEWKKESVFTIEQLRNLHRVLLNLAPSGIIPERTFAYLLQDMLVQDAEDGREQLAPELWLKLTTFELEKVLLELFCKAELIHWKDFIIYNFMVKMPSVETLLGLKRNFQKKDFNHTGNVTVAEFKTFTFWFEEGFSSTDESDMKRLSLMKELMCDMYKVNENTVNYMAMLFDFCKDHNGTVGFAKALSLILDRPVCWDSNIGKKYVQHVKNNREHHEKAVTERNEEILENKTMVTEVLEAIADEIVHQCDSVVITEVITPNSFEHRSLDGEGCDDQCICSAQCFCAREIEHFSNIAVDFEASFDPSLVYFLDLESILAVEAVILQWHTQVQNVYTKSFREQMARIYRECKNPFFNYAVLAHEFLNNYEFSQILAYTTRFIDKNPPNFVQNLIIFRKN